MAKNLIIAGSGGYGADTTWAAEEMNRANPSDPLWNILGYLDDDSQKIGSDHFGYPVFGDPEALAKSAEGKEIWYFCAIGDNPAREKMAVRLERFGWRAATLIHPTAVCARNVIIGQGAYIGALSVLAPNSRIGNHAIIQLHVSIGHDARIGDFANICPGARISGFCIVGRSALVGSNASLIQNREVGENAHVGSNSLVLQSVPANKSVIGVPAREMPSFGK